MPSPVPRIMLVLFCRSAPLLLATWLTQATCSPAPTIPSTPQTSSAFVNLGYAAYQGNKLGNDINEFLGLRFAKPPLGDLRWRKPVEPVVTTGVQDATKVLDISCSKSDGVFWES